MSKVYRIGRKDMDREPTDQDLSRYKDMGRLLYSYQKATRPLYKRPLYKDPRAFLAILLIVLLAVLISEAMEKERAKGPPDKVQEP